MVFIMGSKSANKSTAKVGRFGVVATTIVCLAFSASLVLLTARVWTGSQNKYAEENRQLDELDYTVDVLNETMQDLSASLLALKKELAVFNGSVHELKNNVVMYRANMTAIKEIIVQLQFNFSGLVNGVIDSEDGLHGFQEGFEKAKTKLEEISDSVHGPKDDQKTNDQFQETSEKIPTAQKPVRATFSIPFIFDWRSNEDDDFYDDGSLEEAGEALDEPDSSLLTVGEVHETEPESFHILILDDAVYNEQTGEKLDRFEVGSDGVSGIDGLQKNNDHIETMASTGLPETSPHELQNTNDEPKEVTGTFREIRGAAPDNLESGSSGGFEGPQKEHRPITVLRMTDRPSGEGP